MTCFSHDRPAGAEVGRGPVAIGVLNRGGNHFAPIVPGGSGPVAPKFGPANPPARPTGTGAEEQLPLPAHRSLLARKKSLPSGGGRVVSRRFR